MATLAESTLTHFWQTPDKDPAKVSAFYLPHDAEGGYVPAAYVQFTAQEEAAFRNPQPTVEQARQAKLAELAHAYNQNLLYAMGLPETATQADIALAAAAFGADDADTLLDMLGAERGGIAAAIAAAETLEAVAVVKVGFRV